MTLVLKPGTERGQLYVRCEESASAAFHDDGSLHHWSGSGQRGGVPMPVNPPTGGTAIGGPPRLREEGDREAVRPSLDQHRRWREIPPATRKSRVVGALDALEEHRDPLPLLLVRGTGEPWKQATAGADRRIGGVRWYVGEIAGMVRGRCSLPGPLVNGAKAKELADLVDDVVARREVPLYRGALEEGRSLAGQKTSAYFLPVVQALPSSASTSSVRGMTATSASDAGSVMAGCLRRGSRSCPRVAQGPGRTPLRQFPVLLAISVISTSSGIVEVDHELP